MAAELLKDGRTYVPDLYSQKKGRTFARTCVWIQKKEKPVSGWSSRKRKVENENPPRQGTGEGGIMSGKT